MLICIEDPKISEEEKVGIDLLAKPFNETLLKLHLQYCKAYSSGNSPEELEAQMKKNADELKAAFEYGNSRLAALDVFMSTTFTDDGFHFAACQFFVADFYHDFDLYSDPEITDIINLIKRNFKT